MTGPQEPYLLTEDDDSSDRASFWHIRDSERWAISHLIDIALESPRVKFNSGLKRSATKLREQLRQGLK
jgi:hypothetical protein